MKTYLSLFLLFARIGGFTFGGGYAMLPLLQRELVEKRNWVTEEELMDYYAIGQCTPGVIAVNTATFIGYKQKKIPGAICATLGVIAPSIVIILALAMFLSAFASFPVVQHAFAGIRIGVCAIVAVGIYKLAKKGLIDVVTVLLFLAAFCATFFLHLSSILIVVGSAVVGVVIRILRRTILKQRGQKK